MRVFFSNKQINIHMSNTLVVLFGLNYVNTDKKLLGCINDVKLMHNFFMSHLRVPAKNISVYHDYTDVTPIGANIIRIIRDSITQVNTSPDLHNLWIHYSGHGSCEVDKNEDEDKLNDVISGKAEYGFDEALVALDNQYILDDKLNKLFSTLNKDKRLICVFDCCHSGTALDLPYRYCYKTNKCVKSKQTGNAITCHAILLSAARDIQTAADAGHISSKYQYTGAFTTALLKAFASTMSLSIDKILDEASQTLKKHKFSQLPQVTSTHMISIHDELIDSPYRRVIQYRIRTYKRYIRQCWYYHTKTGKAIYARYADYYQNKKNKLECVVLA